MADYGERFETATIVSIAIFIVASLVAVFALNAAVRSGDCNTTNYTYCGEAPAPH